MSTFSDKEFKEWYIHLSSEQQRAIDEQLDDKPKQPIVKSATPTLAELQARHKQLLEDVTWKVKSLNQLLAECDRKYPPRQKKSSGNSYEERYVTRRIIYSLFRGLFR